MKNFYWLDLKEEERLIEGVSSFSKKRGRLEISISKDQSIDVEKLVDDYFRKQIDCSVFISHSHSDVEIAKGIQSSLGRKGIKVFIDSECWAYADDVLHEIDNLFCKKKNGGYDYKKRNKTTASMHCILATAIQKQIQRCDHFVFLGTHNSLKDSKKLSTNSPWIYYENYIALSLLNNMNKSLIKGALDEQIKFCFDVSEVLNNQKVIHMTNAQELINAIEEKTSFIGEIANKVSIG